MSGFYQRGFHLARSVRLATRISIAGLALSKALGRWLLLLTLWLSASAGAATYTVTNLNDDGAGSLRDAIVKAKNAADDDVITFQPGLTGTIVLTGQLLIDSNLTINGPGASVLTIDGNKSVEDTTARRVFKIAPAAIVTLDGLTIKNGGDHCWFVSDDLACRASAGGGGIQNEGTLTLRNSIVSDNFVKSSGGGIHNTTTGALIVINSIVSRNQGNNCGGGICNDGTATVLNSTVSGNSTPSYNGGGIGNNGALTVRNSTVSGNSAQRNGGGIHNDGTDGTTTVINSTVSGNSADDGGGISNGVSSISSGTGMVLTVINSTVSGNSAKGYNSRGGGIYSIGNMTITNSTVTGNSAMGTNDFYAGGGGIFSSSNQLTMSNSLIAGNTAALPQRGKEILANQFTSLGRNIFGENGNTGVLADTYNFHPNDLVLSGPVSTVIGPLADNGGPTQTHLPVANSLLLDYGDNALIPTGVTTDQRGKPRIAYGMVDVGAVELDTTPTAYPLTITKVGSGAVTSTPAGFDCSAANINCTFRANIGAQISLTATPITGYRFISWSGGGCSGAGTCAVTMDATKTVTATFSTTAFPPNGVWPTGWITPTTSNAPWTVVGTGDPALESSFGLRSGTIDHQQKSQIQVTDTFQAGTVSFARIVSSEATFDFLRFYVDGIQKGEWSGEVAMDVVSYPLTAGTHTLLWSYEKDEAEFSGSDAAWIDVVSLPPTGGGPTYALTVSKAGTGSGTVTSNPTGINCGADCSESYAANTAVTLTATPATGSVFSGWSGACTGTGSCSMTLSAAKTVTATFGGPPPTYTLTVTKAGTGSGTVTSTPTGINCGTDCSESYAANTAVTLTTTATSDSTFASWGGACTGTSGTCTVTLSAAKTVTATFNLIPTYALTVSKAGTGSGTVTSTPSGIDCGATCSAPFASGATVTLTATPTTGSTFASWGGACTGTSGTCSVTLSAAKTVTATFNLIPTYALTITKAGTGTGTITSIPTGISCGTDCSESYAANTAVTLTAAATTGSIFTGWSGACTGTGSCQVAMTATQVVTATFSLGNSEIFPPDGAWPTGWTTPATSNGNWIVTNSDPAQEGNYSLRSGAINHNQKSQVEVIGNFQAGTVSFARQVSSESGYDALRFFIDGVQQGKSSGELAWAVVSYPVTAGPHTLLWSYEKDESESGGRDSAWIDNVSLPPTTAVVVTNDFVVLQTSSPTTVDAGLGDDIYLLTPTLLTGSETLTLADAQGHNRLQLAGGLVIAASEVGATTLRLTLSNGAQLTVNGADAFSYQVCGNVTVVGNNPPPVTFTTFALETLGVTIPISGTATGGKVTLPATCL